jgi:ethanolaminephosphotransferase
MNQVLADKRDQDPLLTSEQRLNETEVDDFNTKNEPMLADAYHVEEFAKNEPMQADAYHDEDKLMCVKLTPYLSAEARTNLPKYIYRAGDNGFMYQNFFNPVGNKCVEYLPVTLAPNVITFAGFIFSITPYILMTVVYSSHFYNSKGQENIPSWIFYLQSVFYFIYRFLDEIDGKQARRTGNSSPLGLLFDHGFDAYSIGFVVLFFAKAIQLGDNYQPILIQALINLVFHITTIEQYYTGELILSLGNFVSDGCVPFCIMFILMGYYGNSWWV